MPSPNSNFPEVAMRYIAIALSMFAAVWVGSTARYNFAADRNAVAVTDPKKAGIEYELQGEYVGEIETDAGKQKIGIQVIALGEGKFRAVAHMGGLPGDGWPRGGEKHSGEGTLKDDQVLFTPEGDNSEDGPSALLKGGQIVLTHENTAVAELKKVERKSKTLGAKPPQGAIVLFDGSDADEWEHAKLIDGKLLGATGASSKREFGDHSLHIEFRTPFMPEATGQGRGNSGVYVQGRYECQVLDSFGLEGEDNECGGIYSIAKPAVNMCFPPLAWQTYDIDFTAARYDDSGNKIKNARVTIKHNDVVIHKDLELTHGTPGHHEEGPERDSLFLQDHGNPVVFRNIWVVEK
jgi:hypothetical protein